MSVLTRFFHTQKKKESVILIGIGTTSVAGAYVCYEEGELPVVLYTTRLLIEIHAQDSREENMLRTLKTLGDTLVREGAPVLARYTGSGSADRTLVAIDAPWQYISVRVEDFEDEAPFVFTKSLVAKMLEKTQKTEPGKVLTDQSIIGTILNGYETKDPYGKQAQHASIVVLTSRIDEVVAKSITSTLQTTYHARHVISIAGSSLRYQAIQSAFPHERDALVLDATGPCTSIALVRRGLLVALIEVNVSMTDTAVVWMEHVEHELIELGKQYPLARTIFLLTRESEVAPLQETLVAAKLEKLWLSDNPPKIVSVLASHIVGLVRNVSVTAPDLQLLLMVLYYQANKGSSYTPVA